MTPILSQTNYNIPTFDFDLVTSQKYDFTVFFKNTNSYICPTLSCNILENCQINSVVDIGRIYTDGVHNLIINTIFAGTYTICIQCKNKYVDPFSSSLFDITVNCPTTQVIYEPIDFA
jgi:hypothetical protein